MRRLSITSAVVGLALFSVLGAAGCGSSSSDTAAQEPAQAGPVLGAAGEREAPKGASPMLREIYRAFHKPQADPAVPESGPAIAVAERACEGKKPIEVKREFYAEATEEGDLVPDSPEGKMIAELPHYETQSATDAGFTAGQLAADVYEATLPNAEASYGYQGCSYAMALRLKHDLAPR